MTDSSRPIVASPAAERNPATNVTRLAPESFDRAWLDALESIEQLGDMVEIGRHHADRVDGAYLDMLEARVQYGRQCLRDIEGKLVALGYVGYRVPEAAAS